MTQVSTKPTERPRVPRAEREPQATSVVLWEQGRFFAQLLADEDGGGGYGASLGNLKAVSATTLVQALTEQLVPRVLGAAQWPLQATLYLPRLGRINASVRREQGAWNIELDAELDATARWLSGVRQQCQEQLTGALGLAVNLHLSNSGSA
ncbi:type III secretion system HrpP C-terminal domain-containing protein [Pseudomonas sp. Marseille-Q1929]|uniref:type III secretion system HrpP C-terminal domain-containing protein n=1 Tax=Pseudomonas sp. Marseille-Q1929 TaxID=2730402 RepID=UPI001A8D1500|nr:type III secretion system HrpP C-terminal domain-containing protein [Pseudomonas sp. Marseille-Q1929]MBO0492105.1 flagellar hook-length control protein FliK [Pseudomonas sp. Marseille-Q1929]